MAKWLGVCVCVCAIIAWLVFLFCLFAFFFLSFIFVTAGATAPFLSTHPAPPHHHPPDVWGRASGKIASRRRLDRRENVKGGKRGGWVVNVSRTTDTTHWVFGLPFSLSRFPNWPISRLLPPRGQWRFPARTTENNNNNNSNNRPST